MFSRRSFQDNFVSGYLDLGRDRTTLGRYRGVTGDLLWVHGVDRSA